MFDKQQLQNLYRYCYSLTCEKQNAYDLLQNSLEKYIKKNGSKTRPIAYMKGIIRNQFIDDYRRNKIVQFEEMEESVVAADFDVRTLESIVINENMVEHVLRHLDDDEREIIYHWAIEGLSTSQISDELGKPKGTILSKIYRMRKKIIEQFSMDSDVVREIKS